MAALDNLLLLQKYIIYVKPSLFSKKTKFHTDLIHDYSVILVFFLECMIKTKENYNLQSTYV